MKFPGHRTAKLALGVALTGACVMASPLAAWAQAAAPAETKPAKDAKPVKGNAAAASTVNPKADANAPAPVNASAQAAYERELEAIRSALLQTTVVEAPTRVVSTAWVDDKGVLRELSHFQ